MFNKFVDQLSNYGKLNDEELFYLKKHSKIRFFIKNEIILREGNNLNNIYFIIDGCARLFYHVNGKDKTAFFYNEGNFIWPGTSLKHSVPTQKNFKTIEDSVLIQINKDIIQKLINSSGNFEMIVRNAREKELIESQLLIEKFITLSPKERFLNLMETNSNLFQRVAQQHIASFLGISPESLSRIKKRVYTHC